MRTFLWIISIALFLVACDGGEASGPVDSSSSALESSETVSSVVESSSSVQPLSSEEVSSSEAEPVSSSSSEISLSSEQSSSSEGFYVSYGTMIDERDGQVYKTVTIEGEVVDYLTDKPFTYEVKIPRMTWMVTNLNYAYLQPTADLDSSSWCFDNNARFCEKHGRLYLWSAAMDSAALFSEDGKGCGYFASEEDWQVCSNDSADVVRGVCPEGWRLPTYEEDFFFLEWRYWFDEYTYELEKTEPIGYFDGETFTTSSADNFWLSTERKPGSACFDNFEKGAIEYTEGEPIRNAIRVVDKGYAAPVRCVKSESE